MAGVTYDDFGIVTNSDGTYAGIAAFLRTGEPLLVSWTDGDGTQLDLLMAYRPARFGFIGSGMSVSAPLMVGVLREGCFGFAIDGKSSPEYIAEKLGLTAWRKSSTLVKLTDFVNGVRRAMCSGVSS